MDLVFVMSYLCYNCSIWNCLIIYSLGLHILRQTLNTFKLYTYFVVFVSGYPRVCHANTFSQRDPGSRQTEQNWVNASCYIPCFKEDQSATGVVKF